MGRRDDKDESAAQHNITMYDSRDCPTFLYVLYCTLNYIDMYIVLRYTDTPKLIIYLLSLLTFVDGTNCGKNEARIGPDTYAAEVTDCRSQEP